MVLRVGKSFLSLSKLRERSKREILFIFDSVHVIALNEWNQLYFIPRACLYFCLRPSLSTILTEQINLYSHTVHANYVIVCALENLTLRIFLRATLQTHAFVILSSIKRELILCNNFF